MAFTVTPIKNKDNLPRKLNKGMKKKIFSSNYLFFDPHNGTGPMRSVGRSCGLGPTLLALMIDIN